MMIAFSVKKYLIKIKLITKDNKVICSSKIPTNPTWTITAYDQHEAVIYLFVLTYFFNERGDLDNLKFYAEHTANTYKIHIDEIDRRYTYSHFDWTAVADALELLLGNMTSKCKSSLSLKLFENL